MTTYMSTKEAAEYAKVSPGMIRKWVKTGLLRVIRPGRTMIFDIRDIDACMDSLKKGAK
jgi:excisionase family DNA binding protein